jgi:cellobiose phosphorylase
MILLFTPPFDKSEHDPGYIKGYLPGVRENGGQYTHAAIWVAWAYVLLGQGDRAVELFSYLNPISHSDTFEKAGLYKVEPYVISADVYSAASQAGKGGWTWYTGSAGWMYRLGIEAILGFTRVGETLKISPCIPRNWPGFTINYRFGNSNYKIIVENPSGICRGVHQAFLDEKQLPDCLILLTDDGLPHQVRIIMG